MEEVQPGTAAYRAAGQRKDQVDLIMFAANETDPHLQTSEVSIGGIQMTTRDDRGGTPPTVEEAGATAPEVGTVPQPAVKPPPPQSQAVKLGWFKGVFVPVLLNIWGVIMFLRLGWVAGHAGIVQGVMIISLANVVTTLTALSMSAISTNGAIKGGGSYYLISRSLGAAFGGAIGVLFFIAQAIATSLYAIGFAETVVDIMQRNDTEPFTGSDIDDIRVISVLVCFILLLVAFVGVGWYAKCQMVLLVILVTAIISVVSGSFAPTLPGRGTNADLGFVGYPKAPSNAGAAYVVDNITGQKQDFFSVFAVFFPAVTGIMAGANMSGDLKNPSSAIPKGTLLGIVFTYVSYIALLVVVGSVSLRCVVPDDAAACDAANFGTGAWNDAYDVDGVELGGLYYNRIIMQNLSLWAPLVLAGIFAATLSSALASLVGAPRILQAVARDRLFPVRAFNYFSQLPPREGASANEDDDRESPEPIRGYVLTFFIASACCCIGKLDLVAPLISNFFMIAYAFTNYACFAASMSKAPGWRPSFKYYSPYLSLFGAVLCMVIMFALNWQFALVSVILAGVLYVYLLYRAPDKHWGPASEAQQYIKAVKAMGALSRVKTDQEGNVHVKAYRPQYLVLSENGIQHDVAQLSLVAKLFKGRGVMFSGTVIIRPPGASFRNDVLHATRTRQEVKQFIKKHIPLNRRQQDLLHVEALVSPTLRAGLGQLLQCGGMGGLRPNSVCLKYREKWGQMESDAVAEYEGIITDLLLTRMAVLLVRDSGAVFDDNFLRPAFSMVPGAAAASAPTANKTIDVWWLADEGGFAVLVPYLMSINEQFKSNKLRVFTTGTPNENDPDSTLMARDRQAKLGSLLSQLRFPAEPDSIKMDVSVTSEPNIAAFDALFPGLVSVSDVRDFYSPAAATAGAGVRPDAVAALGGAGAGTGTGTGTGTGAGGRIGDPFASASSGPPQSETKSQADGEAKPSQGDAGQAETKDGQPATPAPSPTPLCVDDPRSALPDDVHRLGNLRLETVRLLRSAELIRERSSNAAIVFIVLPLPRASHPLGLLSAWMETLTRDLPPTVLIRGNGSNVVTTLS